MFSRSRTFLSLAICVSLLISTAPLEARNTPMMIGGISLAAVSGLVAGYMGLAVMGLRQFKNGFQDWFKPEGHFFAVTYGEELKKYSNEADKDNYSKKLDQMAKTIGVTRQKLETLTMSEYMKHLSRNQEYPQILGAFKKCCALASAATLAGIAIAIKGYTLA